MRWILICALVATGCLVGCEPKSGDTKTPAKTGATSQPADKTSGDKATDEKATGDKATGDTTTGDKTTGDTKAGDADKTPVAAKLPEVRYYSMAG